MVATQFFLFYFHPENGGRFPPILTTVAYLFKWVVLVQPPMSYIFCWNMTPDSWQLEVLLVGSKKSPNLPGRHCEVQTGSPRSTRAWWVGGLSEWSELVNFQCERDKHPPPPPKKQVECGGFPQKNMVSLEVFPFCFVNKNSYSSHWFFGVFHLRDPSLMQHPVLESWRVLPFLSKHMWTKMTTHLTAYGFGPQRLPLWKHKNWSRRSLGRSICWEGTRTNFMR